METTQEMKDAVKWARFRAVEAYAALTEEVSWYEQREADAMMDALRMSNGLTTAERCSRFAQGLANRERASTSRDMRAELVADWAWDETFRKAIKAEHRPPLEVLLVLEPQEQARVAQMLKEAGTPPSTRARPRV